MDTVIANHANRGRSLCELLRKRVLSAEDYARAEELIRNPYCDINTRGEYDRTPLMILCAKTADIGCDSRPSKLIKLMLDHRQGIQFNLNLT